MMILRLNCEHAIRYTQSWHIRILKLLQHHILGRHGLGSVGAKLFSPGLPAPTRSGRGEVGAPFPLQ